ncbi:N-acetyltransferase [Haloplanus aerogenes]|uniref:N-acetyltransferase n=1 Tax=Haloplanus aerogenes TaxID=660522 RepID=A0A3G8R0J3_9EURY|nr:N-acetyltransferase [Haloplanus aerogenes]
MIRPAIPADQPALVRLQSHLPEPSPGLLAGTLDETALTPATVLVSVEGTEPVGYLLAVPGDDTTYVAELVVAPDYRREGRAKALLSACAEDGSSLTVTVAPDNEAARTLYEACGFEKERRLPDFFDDGPALLYRRD